MQQDHHDAFQSGQQAERQVERRCRTTIVIQLDMERLTRAEQRAEQLRSQLVDIQSKIADFEAKLEQIEYALKPENIERATHGYGSARVRKKRVRRASDSSRKRIQSCGRS